ncbi:WD repeat domain-containing protein 83 [Leptopilina boulardi]|uniref:WD repeat domain-containing protein 83 n=1 Tax=Leptopilina boulardi TaxID=63433 RepID=UPI0021F55E19|nr:WD repeat domain-containing protein 83 [Leptopilina boulardi]
MEYKFLKSIDCQQGAVRAVRFSVDGAYCLTCGSNRRVKLWNPYTGSLLKTYSGHGDEVMDAQSSCDSGQIVSGGLDKSVILWDVATGTPTRRYRGHVAPVTSVRYNEESSMVVSGSRDNSVMCWDVRSRAQDPAQTLNDAKDSISSVKVSDYEILSSSFDCKIRRYDMRNGELLTDYMGEIVTCASFTRDGQCILVSCADGIIRLIDKETGELLGEYSGIPRTDLCLESSVDCNDMRILSGSSDGHLYVWELVSQKLLTKLTADKPLIHATVSISVHPQKNCFLASNGMNIYMWESVTKNDSE